MGNKESRELQDNEMDLQVQEIRSQANTMDARKALANINETLKKGPSSFNWIPASLDLDGTSMWWLRVPLTDGDFKDEEVEILHVCRPVMLWEAIASNDPERTVAHSGYCWKGKCVRCKKDAPEDAIAKFESTIKLLNLQKQIS